MRVYATNRNNGQQYRLKLSPAMARKYDNGALISCGLTIPDDMPEKVFYRLNPEPVANAEYQHSGCQSRCTLRGDNMCQW